MEAIWPALIRGIYGCDAGIGNGLWVLLRAGMEKAAFKGRWKGGVSTDWKTNSLSQPLRRERPISAPLPRFPQVTVVWVQSKSRAGENLACNPSYCHLSTRLSVQVLRQKPVKSRYTIRVVCCDSTLDAEKQVREAYCCVFLTCSHFHFGYFFFFFFLFFERAARSDPPCVAQRRPPSCSTLTDIDGDVRSAWTTSLSNPGLPPVASNNI